MRSLWLRVTRVLRWHSQNMIDAETAAKGLGLTDRTPLKDKLARMDPVVERRSLVVDTVRSGYTTTGTLLYAEEHAVGLPLRVVFPWRLGSGFAHARPWALLGVSDIERYATSEADVIQVRMTSNLARALCPNLAAMHSLEAFFTSPTTALKRISHDRQNRTCVRYAETWPEG